MDANWLSLQDILSRHIVGFSYGTCLLDPCGEEVTFDTVGLQEDLCSGVLMEHCALTFLLTAGHVLRPLRTCFDRGYRILKPTLVHGFHRPAHALKRTEVPFDPETCMVMTEHRLDYGAILIPTGLMKTLKAHGLVALTKADCARDGEQHDLFALPGIPDELRTRTAQDTGTRRDVTLRYEIPMFPVSANYHPPRELVKRISGFYGTIGTLHGRCDGEPRDVDSIVGMSGSPVFGLRIADSSISYRLIGPQSHWNKPAHAIAACYAYRLLDALARALADDDRHR